MRIFGACKYIQHVKPTPNVVWFRLKCEPRVVVTAAASLVHDLDDGDGWGIVFVNENNCQQTMVMLSSVWEKEDEV